jgi:hypothetical protein
MPIDIKELWLGEQGTFSEFLTYFCLFASLLTEDIQLAGQGPVGKVKMVIICPRMWRQKRNAREIKW